MTGILISIEGIEGAGKSTAKQCIASFLEARAIPFIMTREPGGTKVAEAIRELLLTPQPTETILPMTELLLMFAARAQHLAHVIKPALANQQWVISDRFIDASYAYQGGGRQMDLAKLAVLDQWVVGDHYPQLTLLLDLTPDMGMMRLASRGDGSKDRIEAEQTQFFERVRNLYLQRAQADPKRIKLIDASLPLAQVSATIETTLVEFLTQVSL